MHTAQSPSYLHDLNNGVLLQTSLSSTSSPLPPSQQAWWITQQLWPTKHEIATSTRLKGYTAHQGRSLPSPLRRARRKGCCEFFNSPLPLTGARSSQMSSNSLELTRALGGDNTNSGCGAVTSTKPLVSSSPSFSSSSAYINMHHKKSQVPETHTSYTVSARS